MDLGPDLVEANFLERLNRFAARVRVKDGDVLAHVANSGRMRELFVPGVRVWLKRKPGSHRKTGYDLCLVDLGFALVSADARLPNSLVAEASGQRRVAPVRRLYRGQTGVDIRGEQAGLSIARPF